MIVGAVGSGGVIRMSNARMTRGPLTVELYSRAVSSRLTSNPLCFYFRYYSDGGVGGRLSVLTLDNAGNTTLQSTVHGHVMTEWRFSFVPIHTATGPFQVCSVVVSNISQCQITCVCAIAKSRVRVFIYLIFISSDTVKVRVLGLGLVVALGLILPTCRANIVLRVIWNATYLA